MLRITSAIAALLVVLVVSHAQAQESCPETSGPVAFATADLNTERVERHGLDFVSATGLELKHRGGRFTPVAVTGIADNLFFAASGDIDGDGRVDLVGAGETNRFLRVYRNYTTTPTPANWNDPSFTVTPNFGVAYQFVTFTFEDELHPIAVADFNGDGKLDVFWASANYGSAPYETQLFINRSTPGSMSFDPGYDAFGAAASDIGEQRWSGTSTQAVDYNGDRRMDLLISSAEGSGGSVRIFLNTCTLAAPPSPFPADGPLPCANNPTFVYAGELIGDMALGGEGSGEQPSFVYRHIDSDRNLDLLAGSPLCCSTDDRLRLWAGREGRRVTDSFRALDNIGSVTGIVAADFSRDGRLDVITGAEQSHYGTNLGGKTYYYRYDDSTKSLVDPTLISDHLSPVDDIDIMVAIDYDSDPHNTTDFLIGDGQNKSYYMFANRVEPDTYVRCGEVVSEAVDIGSLADEQVVLTAASLDVNFDLNGGSVTFYLSNEDEPNWQPTHSCGVGRVCTAFPKAAGRSLRWKAQLCAADPYSSTPRLRSVDVRYDYTTAKEHYRAGVITSDGVAYVGAIVQPDEAGRFYASNAALTQVYWEAGAKLDAMADNTRAIYTGTEVGAQRFAFETASASDPNLRALLHAATEAQAQDIITWYRSKRFGRNDPPTSSLSRLGAIVTSTPAVVGSPGLPLWYSHASDEIRQEINTFITTYQNRPTVVLVGSQSGLLHAFRNDPTAIGLPANGTEAWAYLPPHVAANLAADYTDSLGGDNVVSHYPDGSPTVADVRLADGELHTVAIVSGGKGSKSLFAIDITDSVTPTGTNGPTPLWTATPGQDRAGYGFSKPVIARVDLGGSPAYVAIAATGHAPDDPSKPFVRGREIEAYNVATGSLLWKFQAACPITSDIAVFETDDDLENGTPTIDGYMDRVVLADACGHIYKLDPTAETAGGWNVNSGMGSIAVATEHGQNAFALFATASTSGALGGESPIAGTIAVRSDATTRLVMFFGTGGLESHDPSLANEFYAVYADTGAVRSKVAGGCQSGVCEKFYGGTVVTSEQVIFTRTIDPEITSGTCSPGTTFLDGFKLNAGEAGAFEVDFSQQIASQVTSGLYGDAGAIYFVTLGGDVVRVGTPRVTDAGGDSALQNQSGTTAGNARADGLVLMGWRQLF